MLTSKCRRSEEQETVIVQNGRVALRPDDVEGVTTLLKEDFMLKYMLQFGMTLFLSWIEQTCPSVP
jgi:hypothetical protein